MAWINLPFLLAAAATQPATQPTTQPSAFEGMPSGMLFWIILLAAMAMAPFVLTMTTSFAKLVVVGSMLRHALGTQQIPPTTVITGLALILTVHIMSPVAVKIYDNYQKRAAADTAAGVAATPVSVLSRIVDSARPPIEEFLQKHSNRQNIALFERLHGKLQKANNLPASKRSDFAQPWGQLIDDATILAPAFILTELTEAFQIGFLIFVPFLVIDLVVSNILLAMGMHMLSPITISMPLKLLLFVMIDGWKLIIQGLVLGYT